MRLMVALLMTLVFSASADLDVWKLDEIISVIPLGSNLNLQLTVFRHLDPIAYYPAELLLIKTPNTVIPDSFSVSEENGVLVSPTDFSEALEVEGFYQILSECRATAIIDESRSNFPDTLFVNYIWEPYGCEPETTESCWILIDESYQAQNIYSNHL